MLEAKQRLDTFIGKQRVAMYKPIQIAEILYRVRTGQDGMGIERLEDVEIYRNPSKRWRDTVTRLLIGQVSTSSQKFQDNLFDDNAVPPTFLKQLAEINNRFPGVVERYIYQRFGLKQKGVRRVMDYINQSDVSGFRLQELLDLARDAGLRRSIDKIYELVVYALFNGLLRELRVTVRVSVDEGMKDILREFEDLTRILLGIDSANLSRAIPAVIYRTGVANAADRGLDMWANFGPAVQVKHVSLSEELAEDVAQEVKADDIVIVCKDAEEEMIRRVCEQLGQRLRGIIRESDLVKWYGRALSPQRRGTLGMKVIENLKSEFRLEFPFSESFPSFYKERGYDQITKPEEECPFWEPDAWETS